MELIVLLLVVAVGAIWYLNYVKYTKKHETEPNKDAEAPYKLETVAEVATPTPPPPLPPPPPPPPPTPSVPEPTVETKPAKHPRVKVVKTTGNKKPTKAKVKKTN